VDNYSSYYLKNPQDYSNNNKSGSRLIPLVGLRSGICVLTLLEPIQWLMSLKPLKSTYKSVTTSSFIITVIFLFSGIVFNGLGNPLHIYNNTIHIASAQQMSDSSTDLDHTKITLTTSTKGGNAIQLGVTEQQGVYRWSDISGKTNPTLNFTVSTDNIVQIQNPTDGEHEMIIESQQGNELATSGDIEPISSGELSFRPNMTGTFEYHCEYHPDAMKGIIEITDG
jgi:hypothetical protein